MPTSSKSLRSQTASLRKERSTIRRSSYHSSSLFDATTVMSTSPTDRRRRTSTRAREMRSASFSQHSPHFADLVVSGTSPIMAGTASSPSPDGGEDTPRTKTGRISTAKKGKPVHKCEDCGKIYTRNEHLKRHQLNHSNKSIPCDVPRCKKRFQRIDLLQRHKEQEHDLNLMNPGSIRPSVTSPSEDSRRKSSTVPLDSLWNDYSGNSSPAAPDWYNLSHPYTSGWSYQDTMFGGMNDSHPNGFGHHFDPAGSRSPASATSSAPHIWAPQYNDSHGRSRNPFSPTSTEVSSCSIPTPFVGVSAAEFEGASNYYEMQDNREDAIITTELNSILSTQDTWGFQPHLASLDRRYLDAYWHCFDPLFSVINRCTFEASDSSPLLKALMVAIGAYHLPDQAAQTLARTLRETCSKLLQERVILDYNQSRLWDLQAVFLFEALSVYCSRRPHGRFSQRFEDLLGGLISDPDDAYHSNPLSMIDMTTANMFGVAESNQRIQWVRLESKRRLLLACYALEVQQNLFFGSHRPVSDKNLPMPCSKALWEASTVEQWQFEAQQEAPNTQPLSDVLAASYAGEFVVEDSFLLNVAIAHSSHSASMDPVGSSPMVPQTLDQTPRSVFTLDAAFLAINTPVYDLLAVSGETFVLGQKLATQDQYQQAYEKLKDWTASEQAILALQSASRLFTMALQQDRVGLIYEDWTLTLAGLVYWACIMWPQQHKVQGRVSPLPPHGITELTQRAVNAASEQSEQVWQEGKAMTWPGARACLAYVRQRIDGRIGWLVQDACGVLGKLIDGRVIDDVHSDESSA